MAKTLMFGSRALAAVIAVVVIAALLLTFWSGGGPQSEIEAKLEALAAAGDIADSDPPQRRLLELRSAVNAALAEDVVVRIHDGEGELSGRAAVLSRLQEVVFSVRELRVSIRGLAVTEQGRHGRRDASAWEARFFLDAEGTGPFGSVRESRQIVARFEELDGEWMMIFVEVSERDDAEPEARP